MSELERQARDLLRRFPLIDGHNDLPWALRQRAAGAPEKVRFVSPAASFESADPAVVNLAAPVTGTHTDLPRLAAGGVGAQFWSVYVPSSLAGDGAVAAVLEQIDLTRRMIAAYPEALELALHRIAQSSPDEQPVDREVPPEGAPQPVVELHRDVHPATETVVQVHK